MKISEAVEGFLYAYKAEGFAPDTIKNYGWRLNVFANYLHQKPLDDLTSDDIYHFFDYLKKDFHPVNCTKKTYDFSPSNHAFYWRTLKVFLTGARKNWTRTTLC